MADEPSEPVAHVSDAHKCNRVREEPLAATFPSQARPFAVERLKKETSFIIQRLEAPGGTASPGRQQCASYPTSKDEKSHDYLF